jgi:hypothetical protein
VVRTNRKTSFEKTGNEREIAEHERATRATKKERRKNGRAKTTARGFRSDRETDVTGDPEDGLEIASCPHCDAPAEVRERNEAGSKTDPVEFVRTYCVVGHWAYWPRRVVTQDVDLSGYNGQ